MFLFAALLARVNLSLFVASKCPDAPRCESFLQPALQAVGGLVDLQLDYIGAPNASAPYGVDCMHGDSECVGNAVQLCVRRHFPFTVDIETERLGPHNSWSLFLRCVGNFASTAESAIPGNTNACLQKLGVPSSVADRIRDCVDGDEGVAMLQQSIARTRRECGAHTEAPRQGCKSCTMHLNGRRACVLDGGAVYNCSGFETPQAWVRQICAAAASDPASQPLPFACRASQPPPRVWGHSYASTDAAASAAFAVKYFGATIVADAHPGCAAGRPREVEVRLPRFDDYRGGGLRLRFVSNPLKPGGDHGVAAHVAAVTTLYGDLSNNSGHHWNQFFDNHLGFYVGRSDELAASLLRDGVPFFTGQSSGVYQSVYVAIPGTGRVVEVLGNWVLAALPPSHVRFSSTDQFCSPKRRRNLRGGPALPWDALGVDYSPGDADTNKTTIAGADPDAAIDFVVRYLGASRVEQHRGPMANGPCVKLAWAEWPDRHQWHVVDYKTADWVSIDGLRPAVPFNISELAAYVEGLRRLDADVHDQYLDYHDIFDVANLTAVAELLDADGVAHLVRGRPADGTCSLYVDLPRNGVGVEMRSSVYGGELRKRCEARPFDLCAAS